MAIILMFCASACFVTMSALVKAMGHSLPVTEIMFLRCVIALPFLLAIIIKRSKPLVTRAWKTLLVRSVFGTVAMFCFYYALTNMPLADCVFIGRTQPLILALLAPLVINEATPRAAWFSIACGLAGAAFIIQPGLAGSPAALVALLASCCAAMAHLMIRRLNRTDDPAVIVFNFTLILALVGAVATIGRFSAPTATQWLFLCGIAFFASFGQFLLTMAYARDRAPVVAAASYASVILSVIYGYIFWRETPSPLSLIGGGLIVLGGIALILARTGTAEPARDFKHRVKM